MLSYIWLNYTKRGNMPHVASGGAVAFLIKQAMREQGLGIRTLARKIVEENEGEKIESWRSQIYRITRDGQEPGPDVARKIARGLGKPDDYLMGPQDDAAFSTALLGQLVLLLEKEPGLGRMRPDLLRELATEVRGLANRLEAVAAEANGQDEEKPA